MRIMLHGMTFASKKIHNVKVKIKLDQELELALVLASDPLLMSRRWDWLLGKMVSRAFELWPGLSPLLLCLLGFDSGLRWRLIRIIARGNLPILVTHFRFCLWFLEGHRDFLRTSLEQRKGNLCWLPLFWMYLVE